MSDDAKITRIEDKVDKIQEHVSSIDMTLVAQHESLKAHMRRSDLLEKHLELMQSEIKPIERHVAMVDGGLKLLGALSIAVGFIAGIIEILTYFR